MNVLSQPAAGNQGSANLGLRDLLDANHDDRLTVRTMRQAPKILDQRPKSDIPNRYEWFVRRGPALQKSYRRCRRQDQ